MRRLCSITRVSWLVLAAAYGLLPAAGAWFIDCEQFHMSTHLQTACTESCENRRSDQHPPFNNAGMQMTLRLADGGPDGDDDRKDVIADPSGLVKMNDVPPPALSEQKDLLLAGSALVK